MPELIIREVLTGRVDPDETGVALVQKRINLPEGKRFRVKSIEMFDDNMRLAGTTGADPSTKSPVNLRSTYVTPYPLVLSNRPWGFTDSMELATGVPRAGAGPYAGDNSVLYKELEWSTTPKNAGLGAGFDPTLTKFSFPNPMTANNNPFEWFTGHLYLSAAYYWAEFPEAQECSLSFYIRIEVINCTKLTSSIGNYKEHLEAQCRSLTSTLNSIDPVSGAAGRSQPAWTFGGILPEIMITSADALTYFNRLASRDYQDMDSISAYRTRFKQATTMNAFNEPYGDSATNIPDWITLLDVSGVTSGVIRPYPPPVKFTGNGNTVMYDKDGQPASIVT
jgi:hypothetical protein